MKLKKLVSRAMSLNLARAMIRNPSRYLYKQFYSTSSDKKGLKMHLELSDIPTEEELDFEVRNLSSFDENSLEYFETIVKCQI